MSAPVQDTDTEFVSEEQEQTYSEMLGELACTCAAGALIRPSSLPSATIDLGDIIADHSRILSSFTSAYSVVTVILKMIACIMDVLCCLVSPFCIIFAIIRLFGTCLPDFFLIFPQFAIPAIIICVIKIILAIIDYILNVLLPIILDIIANIHDLIDAINNQNKDAIAAVAFKVAALIKELFNILGILAVLAALWAMIKALLGAGIGIPCGGGGSSCDGCGDCVDTLTETSISDTDGQFIILYGSNGFNYEILFYSENLKNNFLEIRDYFPRGVDYTKIKNVDDVPYKLNITQVDGSITNYIVTSVDSGGFSSLYELPPEYIADGYLISTDINGVPFPDPLNARFTTKTKTFTFSSTLNKYITLQDTRGQTESFTNGGSWLIQSIYDDYNVLLTRPSDTWDFGGPTEHLRWKLEPTAPSTLTNLDFELDINHEELLRHNLIAVGCHPSVIATKDALNERYPDMANLSLPPLPDLDTLIVNIDNCVTAVGPSNVNEQYVLDNYESIAIEAAGLNDCVSGYLSAFRTEIIDYAKLMYPIIFDPEASDGYFTATPTIQVIGKNSKISLIPFDRNGAKLGVTSPEGVVDVVFNTGFGTLSSVVEEQEDGDPTGEYTSNITSLIPGVAQITATVGERDVAYFNGATLIPQVIEVEFITAEEARRRSSAVTGEVSSEPVGRVG